MNETGTILWFKRDLRVHDHPALARAAALGPVLPLYVVEPSHWRGADSSARQWSFVAECLHDLRDALAALGQPLIVRVGEAGEVIARLCRAHSISRIVSHAETGTARTVARDRRIAGWARETGVGWEELPQTGVVRGPAMDDARPARRAAFMAAGQVSAPDALHPLAGVEPGPIPTAAQLRLEADPCPHRQVGGRGQGTALLEGFLATRGRDYRRAMAAPLTGERACSRLSPHLALGTLSSREAAQAAQAARGGRRGQSEWGASLKAFEARLDWRDHLMQRFEDTPEIESRCLHRAFEGLRPRMPEAALLDAWAQGRTGLPMVDACMRYLRATGWLNFRMRAMVVAVASHHLWLDWRATGAVLARLFTDYEPGIHWNQMQIRSGTTGIDALRLYNPVRQGRDLDPDGAFTRRWVPELADLQDDVLHAPWKWPGARGLLGRAYPEPVVDLVAAERAARAALRELRQNPGFDAEAARLSRRYAGAMPAARGRRRRPRTGQAPPGQLALDL